MTGSALARTTAAITEKARAMYDANQVALIKSTVGDACANDAELAMFIEVCARYELDPFSKQIWAIRIRGKLQIVVSRDGLLALANRSPDFRGCQSFEIRQHDLFAVRTDEHGHCLVTHEWRNDAGEPSHGGKDGEERGPIIGAFAYVRREGHVDTQFMAYRDQYDKHENVWKSHPSAMMIKISEAMSLRKAFSVSGVVGEYEIAPDPTYVASSPPAPLDFGENEVLARELAVTFEALGYRRAKVRTMLRAANTEEKRQALLEQLRAELGDAEEVTPDPADVS